MTTTDKEQLKSELSNALRALVIETRKQSGFVLPEAIELALQDWRYTSVISLLQDKCDSLTEEYFEDLGNGIDVSTAYPEWLEQYIWQQGILLKWKRLRGMYTVHGIDFPLPR